MLIFYKNNHDQKNFIKHEAKILNCLGEHPNIVSLQDVQLEGCKKAGDLHQNISYTVLDLCENGNLYTYINSRMERLSYDTCRFYFAQIAYAIKHMHDCNVAHLDIKPGNILLDSYFNAKLCDFGVARRTKDQASKISQKMGTVKYMAPEIERSTSGNGYSPFKADVYSLGVLFYYMMYGQLPDTKESMYSSSEDGLSVQHTKTSVESVEVQNKDFMDVEMECDFSDSCDPLPLIQSMLNPDPEARLSIYEVLEHPYMTTVFPNDICAYAYEEMNARKSQIISSHKSKMSN